MPQPTLKQLRHPAVSPSNAGLFIKALIVRAAEAADTAVSPYHHYRVTARCELFLTVFYLILFMQNVSHILLSCVYDGGKTLHMFRDDTKLWPLSHITTTAYKWRNLSASSTFLRLQNMTNYTNNFPSPYATRGKKTVKQLHPQLRCKRHGHTSNVNRHSKTTCARQNYRIV